MPEELAVETSEIEGIMERMSRRRGGPFRRAFLTRALRAVDSLAQSMKKASLERAVAAPSDVGALLVALEEEPGNLTLTGDDPRAKARLRGIKAKRRLLSAEGGVLGVKEIAEHLRISRQAVHKRRRVGKLLAVDCGRHGHAYPAWQLVPGGLLTGLQEVLESLSEHGPWIQLAFFLTRNLALDGERPLDALRDGRVPEVVRAAHFLGEQATP